MTTPSADHRPIAEILARANTLSARERWAELVNAGAALQDAGRLSDARAVLQPVVAQTRPLVGAAGDRDAAFALSAALVNLAIIDVAHGSDVDLAHAEHLLDDAEQHAAALGLAGRLGTIEVNRARIASLRGQVTQARRALARAETHYRQHGTPTDVAWAKRALGASMAAAGQLDDALALQLEALELFRDSRDAEQADTTEVGLLAIRTQLGQPISLAERSRLEQISRRLPAEAALQLLGNLGNLAMNDDLDAAERLWVQARERSRQERRAVDEARADLALAGVAQRRGRLDAALEQTLAAGERLRQLGAWEPAARADINAALLLGRLADQRPEGVAKLRRQAVERVLRGVESLDRLRHSLPTATARRALLRARYPQLFIAALEAAMKADQPELAAALVERARMQPVLASRRPGDGGYFEPPALAARPGAPGVGGEPPGVDLTTLARRLAGPDGRWIGWWRADADLLRAYVGQQRTRVAASPFPAVARRQLDQCLARVAPGEAKLAGIDARLAGRLALRRAAAGPLLADGRLSRGIAATFPPAVRAAAEADGDMAGTALDDVLWPLSQALLGEDLLAELRARDDSTRLRLVVAPPPQLADVPWPLLPLNTPDDDAPKRVDRLLDAANIVVGLPAALVAAGAAARGGDTTLAILDPTGDLPFTRRLDIDAVRLGHGDGPDATRRAVLSALDESVGLLVLSGHVRPGVADDPAAAALLLSDGRGGVDELTVNELATAGAPPTCIVLGCDGSGGGVGDEWTGLATGLLWAGATWVVTSTWPTTEDRHTTASDASLVAAVQTLGPREGLWSWQRDQLAAWRRTPDDPACSPYRWAGMIICGSGSAA